MTVKELREACKTLVCNECPHIQLCTKFLSIFGTYPFDLSNIEAERYGELKIE